MNIALTPPKTIADSKRVLVGDGNITFRVVLNPPKTIADTKRVAMGDASITFR